MYCSDCGSKTNKSARYCESCGARLNNEKLNSLEVQSITNYQEVKKTNPLTTVAGLVSFVITFVFVYWIFGGGILGGALAGGVAGAVAWFISSISVTSSKGTE